MYSYRITKYNPAKRMPNGAYLDNNEWTSISDIKNNKDMVEYLEKEKAYIDTVINICEFLKVNSLYIKGLEVINNKYAKKYVDGQILYISEISDCVRLILREYIWAKIVTKKCEFHFGYDYYMYVVSYVAPLPNCIISNTLYKEVFLSPYLYDEHN